MYVDTYMLCIYICINLCLYACIIIQFFEGVVLLFAVWVCMGLIGSFVRYVWHLAGKSSHSLRMLHYWLVLSSICYFPFHIWDVILPIDKLIFLKMVIAPRTRLLLNSNGQPFYLHFSQLESPMFLGSIHVISARSRDLFLPAEISTRWCRTPVMGVQSH